MILNGARTKHLQITLEDIGKIHQCGLISYLIAVKIENAEDIFK